jgi:hypothetical protein
VDIGCDAIDVEIGVDLAKARRRYIPPPKLRLWEGYAALEILRLRTGTSAEDYLINASASTSRLK